MKTIHRRHPEIELFEGSIDDIELVPEDHSTYSWITEDNVGTMFTAGREANDPELAVIKKGFALLRGEMPKI